MQSRYFVTHQGQGLSGIPGEQPRYRALPPTPRYFVMPSQHGMGNNVLRAFDGGPSVELSGPSEQAVISGVGRFIREHPVLTAFGVGLAVGVTLAKAFPLEE
jgi:hypothetical protein